MGRAATGWAAVLALAAAVPLLLDGQVFLASCVLIALYGSINLMWALVIGTAGMFSFATVAIFGVSAYSAAYVASEFGWSWPPMLAVAAVVGVAAGLLVALPAIRLRGVYFALLTLGVVELCRAYVVQSEAVGRGTGIVGFDGFVPESIVATENQVVVGYYAGLALLAVCVVVHRMVDGGRLGLLLRTARESEPFALSLGIDVVRARLGVLVISSGFLGLAGGFYAGYYRAVAPSIFSFETLLILLAMMVIGGLYSAGGILVGTALLVFIDHHFLDAGPVRLIAIGALMLVITLLARQGLAGIPARVIAWIQEEEEEVTDESLGTAGAERLRPAPALSIAKRGGPDHAERGGPDHAS